MITACYWLLLKLLNFTSYSARDPTLFADEYKLSTPLGSADVVLPRLRNDINFTQYSRVLGQALLCGPDAPKGFDGEWQVPVLYQRSYAWYGCAM